MATLIELEAAEKARQADEQAKKDRLQKLAEAWAQQVKELVLSPVIREMNENWNAKLELADNGIAVKSGLILSPRDKEAVASKGTVVMAEFALQQFKMLITQKGGLRRQQVQTPGYEKVGKIIAFSPVHTQGIAHEDMKIDLSFIAALINEAPLQKLHKGGDELIRRLIEAEIRLDGMSLFASRTLEDGADKFRQQLVAAKLAGRLEGIVPKG